MLLSSTQTPSILVFSPSVTSYLIKESFLQAVYGFFVSIQSVDLLSFIVIFSSNTVNIMTDIFGFLSFYYVFYFYPPFFCVLLLIAFFWIILIFIIPFLLYSLANILFLVVLRGCIMQTCKSNYFKFYFSASLIMPESHSFTYQPHVSHGCHAFYSTHTLNFTIIVLNNLFVLTHIVILPLFLIPSCISMF